MLARTSKAFWTGTRLRPSLLSSFVRVANLWRRWYHKNTTTGWTESVQRTHLNWMHSFIFSCGTDSGRASKILCVCVRPEVGFCAAGCLSHHNYRKSCSKNQFIHFYWTTYHTCPLRRRETWRFSFNAWRNPLIFQHPVADCSILSALLWWSSTISSSSIFMIECVLRTIALSHSEKGIIDIKLAAVEFSIFSHSVLFEYTLLLWGFFLGIRYIRFANGTYACCAARTRFISSLRILSFFLHGRWDATCGRYSPQHFHNQMFLRHAFLSEWWYWINTFMIYLSFYRACCGWWRWLCSCFHYLPYVNNDASTHRMCDADTNLSCKWHIGRAPIWSNSAAKFYYRPVEIDGPSPYFDSRSAIISSKGDNLIA